MTTQQAFRVDVHHHLVPPEYVAALARIGVTGAGGEDFPTWSPEQSLAMMDRQGIATAIFSLSAPGVFFGDSDLARDLARMSNESAARTVSDNPHRLGFFATLPLPDVDDALRELDYAMDMLHTDGVILLSNYAGQYLGDPAFEPLFAELNRRRAIVFLHPTAAIGAQCPRATTRAPRSQAFPAPCSSSSLIPRALSPICSRREHWNAPQTCAIIPHAGGTVPYLALRIAAGAMWVAGKVTAGATWGMGMNQQQQFAQVAQIGAAMSQLQRLYYDTAFSDPLSVFPSLLNASI